MAQRISRAKQRVKDKTFRVELERLDVVLHVLYLIFNEGYTASSGPELARVELTREAIRLTRLVHRLLPDDGEVAGLLALMLLTDARRAARSRPRRARPAGRAGPLALGRGRDRRGRRADRGRRSRVGPVGPYQLQAAIAAVHAEAPRAADTDWPQILALYDLLDRLAPNPMVTLNRAVAVGMVSGPAAGLAALDGLDDAAPGPPPPRRRPSPPPRTSRRPRPGARTPTAPRPAPPPPSRNAATSKPEPRNLKGTVPFS